MQNRFTQYKNSGIHYCLYGTGERPLFCFHGYGEDATAFACLENGLGKDYTIIAVDLPFHGQTQWNEGFNLTPTQLVTIICAIRDAIFPVTPVHIELLGFSMGGRVVLQLLQIIPQQIKCAVLVAPDGLHKNPWYVFSTQTFIGNKIFRRTMHKPGWLFWLLRLAERYKLANQSIIKVAHYYLDDGDERIQLYERWTTMRAFKPKLPLIKKLIKQNNITVRFLFGRYDNIILSERSAIFKEDAQNVQVYVIDAGHRLMQQKYAGEITKLFYQ